MMRWASYDVKLVNWNKRFVLEFYLVLLPLNIKYPILVRTEVFALPYLLNAESGLDHKLVVVPCTETRTQASVFLLSM